MRAILGRTGFAVMLLLAAAPTRAVSPRYSVSGHVSTGLFCDSDAVAVEVVLAPIGRSVSTDEDGTFRFDSVPEGDYLLTVDGSESQLRLTVDGRDEVVAYCLDCFLSVQPRHGVAGSVVTAAGSCYPLHSGRPGIITFDGVTVGEANGSTGGGFQIRILIPRGAEPGPHQLHLAAARAVSPKAI